MEYKNKETKRLSKCYDNVVLGKNEGLRILKGKRVVDVNVTKSGKEKTLNTKNIIVDVGGFLFKSDIPGILPTIISNRAFNLEEHLNRIFVASIGYITYKFSIIRDILGSYIILMYHMEKHVEKVKYGYA